MISILEIFVTALGLSMDAFSASICKGLGMKKIKLIQALFIAGVFGVFQGLFPLGGYLLVKAAETSEQLQNVININAHFIAAILLFIIGGKMIWDACEKKMKSGPDNSSFKIAEILVLGVATGIDALMVGFAFGAMDVEILPACLIITGVTFIVCFAGVFIGHFFGSRWEKPATIIGGLVLIALGIKFL